MDFKKKFLLTLGVLGASAAVAAGGSLATFNAQTTNPGNTFATGTLVMSNQVDSGTVCLSTNGGTTDTNANNCSKVFDLGVKKSGDSSTTHLTIKNEGSIDATALKAFASGCTDGNATLESYHGTGLPCSVVQLYIQQTDATFTAHTACIYGGAAVANTCDFSDTSKTLTDFATNHTSSTNGVTIGSGLTAGTSDYFIIGVKLPDVNNSFQGRQASIDLTWFMQ